MGAPTQTPRVPVSAVLRRLPRIMLPTAALPALTYIVPGLNPFKLPHLDLTGPLALAAYGVAQSAGKYGIPWICIALTTLVVSRPGLRWTQRAVESLVIVLAIAVLLGGGAYLNEHVVKPAFAVYRPNIMELARTPPEAPALGMSEEAFYALPDKAARSEYLKSVLTPEAPLRACVRDHWITETGYSFPSGHSFSAMWFVTFFLAMGLSHYSANRLWPFYLLVPWAVAVCFSRPILRVHSPTDVCVGGLEGVAVGMLAFLLVRWVLSRLLPESVCGPRTSTPMSFDLQPILKGELVELRPLRPDDFDALFAVASDPLIWEQHPSSDRYQEEVFRKFFRDALDSGGALIAIDAKDGRVIGSSRYHGYDAQTSEVEIGWTFLARSHWGGRYNGEMKRLMLQHAFRFVERVVFRIGPDNQRSRRAVEKIGGVLVGTRTDATGRECVMYQITAGMFGHEERSRSE
jgi:RimJ/RimL family protein N-acetyltransferase/membrane-associated phospholipid phosphatase